MAIQFCPRCLWDTPMYVVKRKDVEIDYCIMCRGVWLERGELDRLLEREAAGSDETSSPCDTRAGEVAPETKGQARANAASGRTGILGELFDFGEKR